MALGYSEKQDYIARRSRLESFFWGIITPIFPYVRDTLLFLRIIKHEGRQRYILGNLAPGRTTKGLQEHLLQEGFHNHFLAWVDDDEVLSLRRCEDRKYQYHLRIFKDGEVRGHYERTPESNIIDHFMEWSMEERREIFLSFLGDWVIPRASKKRER